MELSFEQKAAFFRQKQSWSYEQKIDHAKRLIDSFINEIEIERGGNTHVSVGGLDSLTLLSFIRKYHGDIPAISVSSLEDKSIQKIHEETGIIRLKTKKSKVEVLNEFGFPVLSKDKANKIKTINNPTEQNKTVRHAIMTGECGEQGHFAKDSKMKLPLKWQKLFCGRENSNCKRAPFDVSDDCCYWMKELPCDEWAAEHNSYAFLGLMASEGGRREKALISNGCNYFGKDRKSIRSCPFAIFLRQDLLRLALDLDVPIPKIYGTIEQKPDGTLYTTQAQRTGCPMCGFGIHIEKRPHRFDRLKEDNPDEWRFWMYECVTDKQTGEKYGWGRVLDYIGVEWENPIGALKGQIGFFDNPSEGATI